MTLNSASIEILKNVSGAGISAAQSWPGGRGALAITGTFGGTSAALQFQGLTGMWLPVQTVAGAAAVLTAPGSALFEHPPGLFRIVTTGGAPVGLYARADRTLA